MNISPRISTSNAIFSRKKKKKERKCSVTGFEVRADVTPWQAETVVPQTFFLSRLQNQLMQLFYLPPLSCVFQLPSPSKTLV